MKEYLAKKVNSAMKINDERWEKALVARLDYVWQSCHPSPFTTEARLVHSDDGVTVKLSTNEWPITVTVMENNMSVCGDSCMEFFFRPALEDNADMNFEINPAGVTLVEKSPTPPPRPTVDTRESGVRAETMIFPGKGWCALIYIPFSFLYQHYTRIDKEWSANFYKCGDDSALQHYSTWNPVGTPFADYHRPEFFGKIRLSDEEI